MNGIFRAISESRRCLKRFRQDLIKAGRLFIRMAILFLVALLAGYWHNANHPMGVHLTEVKVTKDAADGRTRRPQPNIAGMLTHSLREQDASVPKDEMLEKTTVGEVAAVSVTNETLQVRILDDVAPEDPVPCSLGVFWEEIEPEVEKGRVLLLDARSESAFKAGHLPHAISIPLAYWQQHLEELKARASKDRWIVVYCGNTECTTAARLANLLLTNTEFRNIRYLYEGYWDWKVLASQATPVSELSNHE